VTDAPRINPDTMRRETASLFYLLGGMGAKHLVLVGGLVPPMLVPTPAEPHIGSADIDLCLSVAFTEGATREYYKSIEAKIAAHFEPVESTSFRWRKRSDAPGVPLLVDFLAPESAADTVVMDGTRQLDRPPAAANTGQRLRPLALKAGELMDHDAQDSVLTVDYVYGPGSARVTVRHTGPVGLLTAKAEALNGRAEAKDGYDVAWYCLHAADTPEQVADIIKARPAFAHELVPEALQLLRQAFAEPDLQAPVGYALLARPDAPERSAEHEQACNDAHLVVTEVVDRLVEAIPWDKLAS
jgi:hypothetical protein